MRALKILGVLVLLVLLGLSWLWFNRETLLTATAEPWEPPVAAASAEPAAPREPCAQRDPLRRPFFGDLHVHTGYSFDARSRDMLGNADDAYRFARGETIGLGPFDENRIGSRPIRLDRPLDFAAVTDHAEWIGEIAICTEPDQAGYDSDSCRAYRGEIPPPNWWIQLLGSGSGAGARMLTIVGGGGRNLDICGADGARCRAALKSAWERNQAVTEAHYDRTGDCSFTSFHGYEYSNTAARSKVHRNVIFRNERVPELPVSSLEETDPFGLWGQLDALCANASGDCEAISIPHNPNVSNGRMFIVPWRDRPLDEQRRMAELRARYEPVVEMMQVKGESECKSGMWQVFGEDELCDFEKIRGLDGRRPEDCRDDYGSGGTAGLGCQSRLDFARYALIEGMVEESRIGVNPYRFGFAGSTDTHNASPGDVDEDDYQGCCSNRDATVVDRLRPGRSFAGAPVAMRNPGGLMGVWAEENSRDSLFEAMARREVFATSGPRIVPRLFVGANLSEDVCDESFVERGYAAGVPMGGVIEGVQGGSPVFAAAASADPTGGLLQRMQVVKVWHDREGNFHQAVHDIAGDANNGAAVDPATCAVSGPGESQLCTTWRDPDFDPERAAAYYLRVLENPACRWSWRQCLALPETERPSTCSDSSIPRVIQERAWSSPVWYSPGEGDSAD